MTHDSRQVGRGRPVRVRPRRQRTTATSFAAAAVAAGAAALLVDHALADVGRRPARRRRHAPGDGPGRRAPCTATRAATLTVVGITGTNGKTTTTHLLASILRAAGRPTDRDRHAVGRHTTPEAPELQARLAGCRAAGDRAVVMEVSSHALALHRVDGTRFAAAVFTNLGNDHLDLHGTVEEYFRAKARLFTPELVAVGVTNVDDPHGRLLLDAAPIEMVPYSLADADDLVVTADHHALTWRGRARSSVPLGGAFNVANTLAAATTAAALGIEPPTPSSPAWPPPTPCPGASSGSAPPARHDDVVVIVDYAHTPDGLDAGHRSPPAAVDRRPGHRRVRRRRRPRSRQAAADGRRRRRPAPTRSS